MMFQELLAQADAGGMPSWILALIRAGPGTLAVALMFWWLVRGLPADRATTAAERAAEREALALERAADRKAEIEKSAAMERLTTLLLERFATGEKQ